VLAALLWAVAALPAGAAGDAARGGQRAADPCANCHGDQGVSETEGVPSLAGMPAEFITLQMILFREGLRNTPPMPEFARGLTDQEVEDLAAFYAALPPEPPPDREARDEARAARGRELAAQHRCGICHLPDFRGRNQMPRLAAQREDYLVHALTQYRDNQRVGTDTQMNGVMYGLSDADIAALAHFLAHAE